MKSSLSFLIIVFAFFSACEQANSIFSINNQPIDSVKLIKTIDKFQFKKYLFELSENNVDCLLKYEKGKVEKIIKLNIPTPCKVVRAEYNNIVKIDTAYQDIFQVAGGITVDKTKCANSNYEIAISFQSIVFRIDEPYLGRVVSITNCVSDGLNAGEISFASDSERGYSWRKIHNISEEEYLSPIIEANKFNFKKFFFELKEVDGSCEVTYHKGKLNRTVKLEVGIPCKVVRMPSFTKRQGDDVSFYDYNKKVSMLMIVGDVKSSPTNCRDEESATQSQFLVVLENEIKLDKLFKSPGNICIPMQIGFPGAWLIADEMLKERN